MKPVLGVVIFLVGSILAVGQVTETDWVRGTDFSRYHSYTWATSVYPIQDPDASMGIASIVQAELQAKEVQFVGPQQKFDLFVTYNAQINPDPQKPSRKLITVALRIFDSRNNQVIWRAGGNVALVNDKKQNRISVRELIAAMFQKYPPS